jgi:HAD superfamily hydrolase (TIGR01509 family)
MKGAGSADTENVDLVVFDLDGTLVDSREDISRAVNQGILAVGGKVCPSREIIPHIGRPLVEIFQDLLPTSLRSMAPRAAENYRQYFSAHCVENSRLYPGVSECLADLKTVSRAVATTKMTFMAVKVIQEMGIAGHFDLIHGSDGIPHKPDPAVLLRVLEGLGKEAKRTWVVGDTVYDVQAGKAAGMRTCAVTYGFGLVHELEQAGPDLLLDNLADLPGRIGVL